MSESLERCPYCGAEVQWHRGLVTCEHCSSVLQEGDAPTTPREQRPIPEESAEETSSPPPKASAGSGIFSSIGSMAPLVACMPFAVVIVGILGVCAVCIVMICAGALTTPTAPSPTTEVTTPITPEAPIGETPAANTPPMVEAPLEQPLEPPLAEAPLE